MHGNSAEPENKGMQPETDFADFYFRVISKLYDLKCLQISNDVKFALRDIKSVRHDGNKSQQTFFYYKTPPFRCAYLYAYSVIHSVMIYSEFLKHLELNKRIMVPTLCTESLKICCIGGGPGTEAVAICKLINDFVFRTRSESDESLLEIKATIIDKIHHWKREEKAIINAANDKSNSLISKRMILHLDFMKADILKPFENNLKERIQKADFVIVIKVGNHIQDKNAENRHLELKNMLRNVINCMGENSCLFMLDSVRRNFCHNMRKVLRETIGTSLLTKSIHKDYVLDQNSVQKFSDLMEYNDKLKYHPVLPTIHGKVSSCMLIKNINSAKENTKCSSQTVSISEMNPENSRFSDMQCKENPVLCKRERDSKTKSRVTPKAKVSQNKQLERKKKQNINYLKIEKMENNCVYLRKTEGKKDVVPHTVGFLVRVKSCRHLCRVCGRKTYSFN